MSAPRKSVLRVRAGGQRVTAEQAGQRVHAYIGKRKPWRSGVLVEGQGQRATRVMATRTDIGTRNARLAATAAERAPHGARNPHSDAQYVAGERAFYITAERVDSLDSERPAPSGQRQPKHYAADGTRTDSPRCGDRAPGGQCPHDSHHNGR